MPRTTPTMQDLVPLYVDGVFIHGRTYRVSPGWYISAFGHALTTKLGKDLSFSRRQDVERVIAGFIEEGVTIIQLTTATDDELRRLAYSLLAW